jgi:hypothetical protein
MGLDIVVHPKASILTGERRIVDKELQNLLTSINCKSDVGISHESHTNRSEAL